MDQQSIAIVMWVLALTSLVFLSSVASFLRLLMRRLTPLAARRLFQVEENRRIKVDRERVGVSLSALHGAAMGLFAVGVTGLMFHLQPQHLWENLGASLVVVLAAVALCDQLIPFRLVARYDEPELILAQSMPLLRRSVLVSLPITFPVHLSTTIARLLESQEAEPATPQEDLQELIEAGQEEGLIEKSEGELMQSVVEFGDKVVREVMTPRSEIAALEINAPVEELRRMVREKRQSRYPVYSGQLDHIEGIVNVRDLSQVSAEEQLKITLRALVHPVPFVPETKPVRELLKELQQTTTQMAVVIDEYGSVSGLVTVEDLVEEIIGDIRDEVEPHAQDIVQESADTFVVAGQTVLAQVADRLAVALEARDYSTVAGLILAHLGHVPTAGEKVETNGVTFEVLDADPRKVRKVRVRLSAAARSATGHAD